MELKLRLFRTELAIEVGVYKEQGASFWGQEKRHSALSCCCRREV
jgi:hypothetical protein